MTSITILHKVCRPLIWLLTFIETEIFHYLNSKTEPFVSVGVEKNRDTVYRSLKINLMLCLFCFVFLNFTSCLFVSESS